MFRSFWGPDVPYYCWWFRNPANQLRLVAYPIIYRVLYVSQVVSRISSINSMTLRIQTPPLSRFDGPNPIPNI